jgi:4-hydroxy-3-methylbut-2-enyl diphosphate reductase IspH
VQEALVALTKQVASLSEEFRQLRDVSLMRQTTELKADMMSIRDMVEKMTESGNKEFNQLSDTLLVCNNKMNLSHL